MRRKQAVIRNKKNSPHANSELRFKNIPLPLVSGGDHKSSPGDRWYHLTVGPTETLEG